MDNKQQKGIHALNQSFKKYEQVNKEQSYHLAEKADIEQFDEEYEIKTCNLQLFFEGGETGKAQFAEQLGSALEGIGFAILEGHGIDPVLFEAGEQKVKELFTQIPLSEKMPYAAQRFGSVNQGYFPIKETTIIHPDMVEGWVFCRRAFHLDPTDPFNETAFWPRPGLEPVFRKIVQANERLILPIMQSILQYFQLDPHSYDHKLTKTNFGFRLNYYPAITKEALSSGAGRMLGHEDVDLFTLLPASKVEGLQVLNRENGKWIRLKAKPGTIILNTGDYMQRITNDRLPSTTHRVSNPTNQKLFGQARISMPMAVYVWEEEILEVLPGLGAPKYDPISAIQFHTNITSKYYGDDYAVNENK